MFQDFLYDIFGLSTGDKILATVIGLGCLLVINGLFLSAWSYRFASRLIQSKQRNLPVDTDSLFSVRAEALKNRKKSVDLHAQYIACNWTLFDKIDELMADGKISSSSLSSNSGFGMYHWLSPLNILSQVGQWGALGIKLFIVGQLILALAIQGGIVCGLFTVAIFAVNAIIASRYEAMLNSAEIQSSKTA